jgi:parvulin-like peptidyl-prolyl isomerase
MTSNARPASRRDRSRESGRRTLYTNLAFGLIVVAAFGILAAAAGASYYGDHLAAVATVDGHTITKDDLRDRFNVDVWRLNELESQLRDAVSTGRITKDLSDQQIAQVDQAKQDTQTVLSQSLQNLVDAQLQSELAAKMGITVTPADVDAKLLQEATRAEARDVWVIEFQPDVTAPATTPTAIQSSQALTKANAALAQLKAGTAWDTVAKESTDTTGPAGGDLGMTEKDNSSFDPAYLNAVFAIQPNAFTDVIKGADGIYRIGRVTTIIPAAVDANYQQKIKDQGLSLDVYRKAVQADVTRQDLEDRIVADSTTKPSDQRHVLEIMLTQQTDQNTGQPIVTDEVDARHILYAPTSDPSASTPPSNDPGWEVAHQHALRTYYELLKDPSKFADIAKSDSADTGSAANGGDLGYLSQADLVAPFGDAIFAPNLTPNEILPPVQTQFGWHVIQFVARREPALTRMSGFTLDLAKSGADFGAIAKANSEASDANKGGDMGWIAPNQLSSKLETAIDKLAVNQVSDVVTDGTSLYLFKVIDEQTRLPDADQIATLKTGAFQNWYDGQKASAAITTDPAYAPSSSGSSSLTGG